MEWFGEVRIELPDGARPASNDYLDKMKLLYDALSEYLGGMELEPAMLGLAGGLETYLDDDDLNGAAEGRSGYPPRPPRESGDRVRGPR